MRLTIHTVMNNVPKGQHFHNKKFYADLKYLITTLFIIGGHYILSEININFLNYSNWIMLISIVAMLIFLIVDQLREKRH